MQCYPQKLLINFTLFVLLGIIIYVLQDSSFIYQNKYENAFNIPNITIEEYNVWCIFTKANKNYRLRENFRRFTRSLLSRSSIPISLNVISDNSSLSIAGEIIDSLRPFAATTFIVKYNDVNELAESLSDLVQIMQPHFSSQPGSYYSDVLFFLSIGLYRVTSQEKVIMMDIDTELRVDIRQLFDEFHNMPPQALIAASPEQSPVYRHTLYMFRAANRESKFGNPPVTGGNPGLNSGVLLLNLARQRNSTLYKNLLNKSNVSKLCAKYQFHGHLGDQDWYTLISDEHPELIHFLDCTWNRQLCLWWRHHGYHDVFDQFHYCPGEVKVYHGNCNTEIPSRLMLTNQSNRETLYGKICSILRSTITTVRPAACLAVVKCKINIPHDLSLMTRV